MSVRHADSFSSEPLELSDPTTLWLKASAEHRSSRRNGDFALRHAAAISDARATGVCATAMMLEPTATPSLCASPVAPMTTDSCVCMPKAAGVANAVDSEEPSLTLGSTPLLSWAPLSVFTWHFSGPTVTEYSTTSASSKITSRRCGPHGSFSSGTLRKRL